MRAPSLRSQLIEVAKLALRGAIIDSRMNRMDHCGWDDVPDLARKARAVLKRARRVRK